MHPKLGSLELNLHFKHDFKNTLLCFPRRKYWALVGKSYSACWKQSSGSVSVPTGPACPRWELREGQIWLSPRLQQAAVCAPHFPGADTFHACHSWEVVFQGGLEKIHFSFIQHLFIAAEKLSSCRFVVRHPNCLRAPQPLAWLLLQQFIWEHKGPRTGLQTSPAGSWRCWRNTKQQLLQSNRKWGCYAEQKQVSTPAWAFCWRGSALGSWRQHKWAREGMPVQVMPAVMGAWSCQIPSGSTHPHHTAPSPAMLQLPRCRIGKTLKLTYFSDQGDEQMYKNLIFLKVHRHADSNALTGACQPSQAWACCYKH